MERDTSHSALFYLWQEVAKLASPIHKSFLDTHVPSTWLHETSGQGPFTLKKEEEDAHSFQVSNSSCQQRSSHMPQHNQTKKVKEENHSSKVPTFFEPHPERNSSWKVLSLINLQCERLLHQSDTEDSNQGSASSVTTFSHSIDKDSTATARVTDQGVGGDCMSAHCTLRPSVLTYEREEIPACVSPVEDVGVCNGGAGSFKSQCFEKDSSLCCFVQSQSEKADTPEENAAATSHPQKEEKREDKFSVDRQFEGTQKYKECFSSEQNIQNVPFSENASSETHILSASLLAPHSNEDVSVVLSKPALTLDHNGNHVLTAEALCDTQLLPTSSALTSSQSASLLNSITETSHSLSKQDDKIITSKPECAQAPIEGISPPVAQLKYTPSAKPEPRPVQKEEDAHPSIRQWRTKTPRKQPHPSRSANIQDPDFQGVTFRIDTELDDSREQCRLLITSKYR